MTALFTDVHTINQKGLERFARFTAKAGGCQMIFGPSGIGKTEIQAYEVAQLGFKMVYLNLSVLEAPDLVGLPYTDPSKLTTKYALPDHFPRAPENPGKEHKGTILLVDEIDKAAPELQAPMLELFQFRSINGQPLDFHAIMTTGNRLDEGAYSTPVNRALTNRCKIYQLIPEFDPWQEWATEKSINPLVVGFLHRNKDYFFRPNKSGDVTAYCSCSPRSWSNTANEIDLAQEMGETDNTFLANLAAGFVGIEASKKFMVYLEHYHDVFPAVMALIQEGRHPNLKDATMEKIVVTAITAVNEIAQKCGVKDPSKKEIDDVKKIVVNVSNWLSTVAMDVQLCAIKSTLTTNQIVSYKMPEVQSFMTMFKEFNRTFK